MNFPNAITSFFKNYFNFRGRASRSEHWYSILFLIIIEIIAVAADLILFPNNLDIGIRFGPINSIIDIGTTSPLWAIHFRRLHDVNKSGLKFYVIPNISFLLIGIILYLQESFDFVALLFLLLLIYSIYLIVIFCFRGSVGPNKYGSDPLEHTQSNKTEENFSIWDENK